MKSTPFGSIEMPLFSTDLPHAIRAEVTCSCFSPNSRIAMSSCLVFIIFEISGQAPPGHNFLRPRHAATHNIVPGRTGPVHKSKRALQSMAAPLQMSSVEHSLAFPRLILVCRATSILDLGIGGGSPRGSSPGTYNLLLGTLWARMITVGRPIHNNRSRRRRPRESPPGRRRRRLRCHLVRL